MSKYVYVTYIRTTPQKLWDALTRPEFIKQYWFGLTQESDWKPGASWAMKFSDGRVADDARSSRSIRRVAWCCAGATGCGPS